MHANVPLRLARSAVFTAVCVTLAAAAHWFAGGAGPRPQVLLVGGLVVMAITVVSAGRERSPGVVIGLLVAAQAFLHQLLGPAAMPSVSGIPGGLGLPNPLDGQGLGSLAGGQGLGSLAGGQGLGSLAGGQGLGSLAYAQAIPGTPSSRILDGFPQGHGLSVSVGMLVAHLTAALLTGWWLSRGEAALWSALRGIGAYTMRRLIVLLARALRLLGVIREHVTLAAGSVTSRAGPSIRPARDRLLRHAVVRRGPPLLHVS
jgi:hypothetical protein